MHWPIQQYHSSSKIDLKIREETEREVNYYFRNGTWGGLNNDSKREIKDEITKNIRELINPHVESIFNQIPQEELDSIISELLPKVLMDLINTLMQICEDRTHSILNR